MTDDRCIKKFVYKGYVIYSNRGSERAISHTHRADSHAMGVVQRALIYWLLIGYEFGTDIAVQFV